MTLKLEKADFDAVADAIGKAEERTSVEFFAVLTKRSDDYQFVAGFFMALGLFVGGLLYVVIARLYWLDVSLLTFSGIELALFVVANMIFRLKPGLAILLVPKAIRFRRAHANAVQQFLAHGISDTSARNGVLVFVSMDEHYAEILADRGVIAKTEQSFWDEAVAKLIAHAKSGEITLGYTQSIELLAIQLTPIFPAFEKKQAGLDDRLVVLSTN